MRRHLADPKLSCRTFPHNMKAPVATGLARVSSARTAVSLAWRRLNLGKTLDRPVCFASHSLWKVNLTQMLRMASALVVTAVYTYVYVHIVAAGDTTGL